MDISSDYERYIKWIWAKQCENLPKSLASVLRSLKVINKQSCPVHTLSCMTFFRPHISRHNDNYELPCNGNI